jgi:hypothetical protein
VPSARRTRSGCDGWRASSGGTSTANESSASSRLAVALRERRAPTLDVLERRAFGDILDDAELGSAATADAVARLVEAVVAERLIRERPSPR